MVSAPLDAHRRAYRWILLIVFLDAMGLMLLSPVIPLIVEDFRSDARTIAALAVTYSAAQFLATPLLGALSDRYGRRPILILSFLGSTVTYLAFGWAPALWVLFAGRLIDGLTGANIGTSQAYLADITGPEQRSRAMAMAGTALGLGFMAGPLFGLLFSRAGMPPHWQAMAAAALAIVSTLVTWWFLPTPAIEMAHTVRRDLNPFRPLIDAFGRAGIRPLLTASFLANFALAALRSVFALYTLVQLQFVQADVNRVMGFLGLMMVIAQGGMVRPAVARLGDRGTLLWGLGISALGFYLVGHVAATWHLYVAVAITAIGVGLSLPTTASLVSRASTADEQGAMLGAAQAAAALGHVVGPLWAGEAFDHIGPGAPFTSGALLVAAALLVVARRRYPDPR